MRRFQGWSSFTQIPKGNQEEVTTDEKGQAVLKGLTRGTHTIQEKAYRMGIPKI